MSTEGSKNLKQSVKTIYDFPLDIQLLLASEEEFPGIYNRWVEDSIYEKQNLHHVKTLSRWEAMEIFKAELPALGISFPKFSVNVQRGRDYDIYQLIHRLGGEPRRGFTRCILHEELTPSMKIYKKENRAWCFGCNKGGNPIDLVMEKLKIDFLEALKFLSI